MRSTVLVPFGKSSTLEEGYVVGIKENTTYEVKEIVKIKHNLTEKQNNHLTEKDLDNPYDYDYVVENESLDNLLKAADRIVKEALWVFK